MHSGVLVIVPAYNEEAALPSVLEELSRTLDDSFDVLVVDDGSADGTYGVAVRAGVSVLRLPFNLGVGGALRAGFRWALSKGYDRAVQLDGDGQHEPAEVPKLLEALGRADLVIGSRFTSTQTNYEIGRVRKGAMRVLRITVQALTGRRFTDTSSGFRAFGRPMMEYFARNYPVEYLGDTVEAVLLALYSGFEVTEVPVTMRPRAGGRPSSRQIKLLYHYLRVLLVIASTASLRARKT